MNLQTACTAQMGTPTGTRTTRKATQPSELDKDVSAQEKRKLRCFIAPAAASLFVEPRSAALYLVRLLTPG